MPNDYYSDSGAPATGSAGSSATIRAEFASVELGLDKLCPLTGNGGKIVAVNAGSTAQEALATTGTGNVVRATAPTLTTPILGTPTSVTLTNATGLPISTGVVGLGAGVATFLATPSSANLAATLTDETGTGAAVFSNSPTLVSPALGTPSSGDAANLTGTAAGLSIGGNAATATTILGGKPGFPINLNGNFQIAQAGTSFAAPVSGAYDLDGWLNGYISSVPVAFTVAQVAGSSAGKLARQVTIATADAAIAAGEYVIESTKIEGSDIVQLIGKTFNVTFNAKLPVTGIHCVSLRNSGNDRSYVAEVNCTAANTMAPYSFTVTNGLPTSGTWNYTNGVGLTLDFCHAAGTTFHTTANAWNTGNFLATVNQVNDCATIGNVWALEDVRIDLGTVVGTEWPTVAASLVRAQKYRRRVTGGLAGQADSTTQVYFAGLISPPMRAAPTISLLSTTPQISSGGASFTGSASAIDDSAIFADSFTIRINGFSGMTAGRGAVARMGAGGQLLDLQSTL